MIRAEEARKIIAAILDMNAHLQTHNAETPEIRRIEYALHEAIQAGRKNITIRWLSDGAIMHLRGHGYTVDQTIWSTDTDPSYNIYI